LTKPIEISAASLLWKKRSEISTRTLFAIIYPIQTSEVLFNGTAMQREDRDM